MPALKRLAAAAFATAVVLTALILPGSPAQAGPSGPSRPSGAVAHQVTVSGFAPGATIHGCPSGYLCIYPGEGWNNDRPSLKFASRGVHELYNQYGWKYVFSNQTDNWIARICNQRGGNDCWLTIYQGELWDIFMDPVDSVVLTP